jgi:PAS domain S-box-containing protein
MKVQDQPQHQNKNSRTEEESVNLRGKAGASEDKYRNLFEKSHTIKLIIDPRTGDIVDANPAAAAFYGWPLERLRRMKVPDLNTMNATDIMRAMAIAEGEERHRYEFVHRLADGSKRDVEVYSGGIDYDGRRMLYSFVFDITERKKSEEALRQLVAQKDMLMRELQHRVKNNLNVIASLLSLEKENSPGVECDRILSQSVDRIKAIANIYERLYLSKDLVRVDLKEYLSSLVKNIFEVNTLKNGKIHFTLSAENASCNSDTALPVGLIVNELVTNSIKYAFGPGTTGKVSISLRQTGETIRIEISDNGSGLEDDFDIEKSSSMGMVLIRSLTAQIRGKISITGKEGATAVLEFPHT